MCVLECVAAFLYVAYVILYSIDSFQKHYVHSCLHYVLHICICFHLGGSPGSTTDDGNLVSASHVFKSAHFSHNNFTLCKPKT